MASLRQLKQKKESLQTINKITHSMENISISKSRKAIKELSNYQNYILDFRKIYKKIIENSSIEKKVYEKSLWILIGSDLGLAGSYNISIAKEFLKNYKNGDEVFIFGNRLSGILNDKYKDSNFFSIEDFKDEQKIFKLINKILSKFIDENYSIQFIYTKYISQVTFTPEIIKALPFESKEEKESLNFEFEPSAKKILNSTLDLYLYSEFVNAYKNAIASEYTSRRIAMENATNNSDELISNLKIEFNRKRQANITQEIIEIIGGSEAVK